MGLLFVGFLVLLPFWSRHVYGQSQVWRDYGLRSHLELFPQILAGWVLGTALTLSLFLIEISLGWVAMQSPAPGFAKIALEGLGVGLGVAFAEELFFRGWMLNELERDYSPTLALGLNASIFALCHFIKPLPEVIRTFPQFPALVLLGLSLVWARRICDRSLGLNIGLHGGLVGGYYWIKVGEWTTYRGNIPPWVTGIDGNPLAGVMGLILLSVLAIGLGRQARQRRTSRL